MNQVFRERITQPSKIRTAWNKGISHGVIEKKKIGVGKKGLFNFVKDKKTKNILTRDCAYAEICIEQKMFKPAIILYGSIIEEILRDKLKSKDNFETLIDKIEKEKSIEPSLLRKIDFIRDFRNYVHIFLEKEGGFEPTEGVAQIAAEVCKSLSEKIKSNI
jgi:hypothetical protein